MCVAIKRQCHGRQPLPETTTAGEKPNQQTELSLQFYKNKRNLDGHDFVKVINILFYPRF
jgi:hypothetical protein